MMTMTGYQWLVTILVITSAVNCKPVAEVEDEDSNLFTSHKEAMVLQIQDNDLSSEDMAVREKRDLSLSNETPEILVNETSSNETSFEDYEKEYLINLTMNLLKQFLHYDNYLKHLKEENSSIRRTTSTPNPAGTLNPKPPTPLPQTGGNTTPDDVRTDTRILQQKLLELNQLDVSQLTRVFNNLHHAAKQGVEDTGITSLCCNIG